MKANRIRGVAAGLCESFASRNNEIDGYWALGVLYRDALLVEKREVNLVLFSAHCDSFSQLYPNVIRTYREWLERRFEKDLRNLISAEIRIQFAIGLPNHLLPFRLTWGEPFEIAVRLVTAAKREFVVTRFGYCGPHNPLRETQSLKREKHHGAKTTPSL